MTLGALDIAVLLLYFGSAVVVGMKVSGKARNIEAYLLGDRNLPWWAILGSIVATETSTATVLSVPGEAFGPSGIKFLQLAIGFVLGRLVIVRLLLPLYFTGRLSTAYEILNQRFGPATRRAASLLFLVTRNLGDGLRLFLAALVLQKLAGWPFLASVIATGVITMVYTFFGGIRSVVWNDCIQLVVYLLGAVAAVFVIVAHVPGGWAELTDFALRSGKLQLFDFRLTLSEPYTFWAGLCGGAVLTIGTHGTDHMMVQRYLSARSQADAGRAIAASGFVVFAQFALFLLIGIGLACYYAGHPEVHFERGDEVFAAFIVQVFPANTGLIGLMLAAILAAAMSTLSSSLNASASAFVNDFYVPLRRTEASSEHLFAVTRGMTIVFGIVQIAIGIWARQLDATVVRNALTIAGFSAGLLLGIFALGVLNSRAGQTAALTGGALGAVVLSIMHFVLPQYGVRIAFPWYGLFGAVATFTAGSIAAFVWPRKESVG